MVVFKHNCIPYLNLFDLGVKCGLHMFLTDLISPSDFIDLQKKQAGVSLFYWTEKFSPKKSTLKIFLIFIKSKTNKLTIKVF